MQTGELIKADGSRETVTPKGKKFTLAELQECVGGYIEIVALKPGNGHATMYINEEGKLIGLSANPGATKLTVVGDYGDTIVGNALIVRNQSKPIRDQR